MNLLEQDLQGLHPFSTSPKVCHEAGRDFIFLPGLKVCGRTVDGLLCPAELHGYTTRLLLSEQISGRGQNWKSFSIVGRTWYTPSWQNVPASLPLAQMLVAHLVMYR
jgi:hypothetical protein